MYLPSYYIRFLSLFEKKKKKKEPSSPRRNKILGSLMRDHHMAIVVVVRRSWRTRVRRDAVSNDASALSCVYSTSGERKDEADLDLFFFFVIAEMRVRACNFSLGDAWPVLFEKFRPCTTRYYLLQLHRGSSFDNYRRFIDIVLGLYRPHKVTE